MPSWVVPAVAAELWGVTVEHVMTEVQSGRVSTRIEGGMLFVDVDPVSQQYAIDATDDVAAPAPYRRPLAWAFAAAAQPLVTAAERDALLSDGAEVSKDDDDDDTPPPDDVPPPLALTVDDVPDWEAVRARVSRNRRPPGTGMREAA